MRPPAGMGTASSRCGAGGLSPILVLEGREPASAEEEDEMYLVSTDELAAQHIAELHRQAEHERLVRALRARRGPARRRAGRVRWGFWSTRPARA